MKRDKLFSVLSIVFTVLALVIFALMSLAIAYTFNLEQGLASVLIGLYCLFIIGVTAVLVLVCGALGIVFSVLKIKRQGSKPLSIITLTVCAVLITITLGIFVAFLLDALSQ